MQKLKYPTMPLHNTKQSNQSAPNEAHPPGALSFQQVSLIWVCSGFSSC